MPFKFLFSRVSLLILAATMPASAQDWHLEGVERRFNFARDAVYEVHVNVDAADVRVEKSAHAGQAMIRAEFTRDSFRLEADFDQIRHLLELTFKKEKWFADYEDSDAIIWIQLPAEVEVNFVARVKAGSGWILATSPLQV